ncbi:MAG: hypothetical protein ACFB0C_13350 [Leptolyngbyaceae cyanobacterium]
MKLLYLTRNPFDWVVAGLLASLLGSASPAEAVTLGFAPIGLKPADEYSRVVSEVAADATDNPINNYQSSVTEAATSNTPAIDTPFEQVLTGAGYNTTIIQSIVSRTTERLSDSIANADVSIFDFDGNQVGYLIADSGISSFSVSSDSKKSWRCKRLQKLMRTDPDAALTADRSVCWNK